MSSRPCTTCGKLVYPTEKVSVSELWVHKAGCLKVCPCHPSASLSISMNRYDFNARRPASSLVAPFVPAQASRSQERSTRAGDQARSIRFKGLTLRSKGIRAGLDAPKLDVRGQMHTRLIVGHVSGSPLDSWDIAHALNVQAHVSSPIRDHPAIHAQRIGSAAGQWPMPSQPLEPQYTGNGSGDDVVRATMGNHIAIEEDLVKNLIKVFQLDTVDKVEISHTGSSGNINNFTGDKTDEEYFSTSAFSTIKPAKRSPLQPTTSSKVTDGGSNAPRPSIIPGAEGGLTLRRITTLASRRMKVEPKRAPLAEIFLNSSTPESESHNPLASSHTDLPIAAPEIAPQDAIKAMRLLESLLPLAAHLIPLPSDGDDDLMRSGEGDGTGIDDDPAFKRAREALVRDMQGEGLELVMLFEEEPLPTSAE